MDETLKKRIEYLKKKLNPDELQKEIHQIEAQSAKPDFWQDQQTAKSQMQKLAQLQEELAKIESLETLWQEGKEKELKKSLSELELKTFLSGPYDSLDAIFSVHAGQGGTEAMDWAQMLERMYIKYFEKKDWSYQLVEETPGEEAGIKSATLTVSGSHVYGFLRHEAGTHRLVRQSPFNADRLRQTSFALVEVLPQVDETNEVEIKENDLDWQFFRASTQGGQNVQKVSTAVRLTHKPTGIVVVSQSERYQERNRKIALQLLKAKLWGLRQAQAKQEEQKLKGGRTKAAWGTQIRSYVLHPYKMVKDLRTGYETSNAEGVLDGDLDGFISAALKQGS